MPNKKNQSRRIPNPNKSKRIVGVSTALKKVNTVEDLFARADINGILNDLDKEKPDIDVLIAIYINKKGELYFHMTENALYSQATWMLESIKFELLNED